MPGRNGMERDSRPLWPEPRRARTCPPAPARQPGRDRSAGPVPRCKRMSPRRARPRLVCGAVPGPQWACDPADAWRLAKKAVAPVAAAFCPEAGIRRLAGDPLRRSSAGSGMLPLLPAAAAAERHVLPPLLWMRRGKNHGRCADRPRYGREWECRGAAPVFPPLLKSGDSPFTRRKWACIGTGEKQRRRLCRQPDRGGQGRLFPQGAPAARPGTQEDILRFFCTFFV